MPHSISMYVPSTINISQKIDNTEWVRQTVEFFMRIFGGVTVLPVKSGYWRSESGEIVSEEITEVISFVDDKNFESCLNLVFSWALSCKYEWKQEKIAVIIDGKMFLI